MLFCITVSKTEHSFKKIKTILRHSNKFPLPSSDQPCMCGTREAGREVWCSWLCSTAVDRGYLGEDVDTRQHFSNAICKRRHQDHSISVCGFLTNSGDNLVLSFCSLDSVGIISKLTSPDLSDSAHLNTHSFHMLHNLDITSSMKTVNYTNGQRKSTHFYPQSPVSGANLTSACAEEESRQPSTVLAVQLTCTFTCHLFFPRPRELTMNLKKANVLVKAPPNSSHTSSLARFLSVNGNLPSYYLRTPPDVLHEAKTLPILHNFPSGLQSN